MSFASLGLNQTLLDAVAEQGYNTPTPIQTEAIPAILEGLDVMAGAQTGTGKTAAFALPILQFLSAQARDSSGKVSVRALILTPTRELAQQVHASVVKYGAQTDLRAALVYGGASINSQIDHLKAGVDIIVATPGRLIDLMYKRAIDLSQVEYMVFDEADRMLDMGFMDEIQRILKVLPSTRQTLLFSATFDDEIFKLSKTLLKTPKLIEVDARNTASIQVEQRVYAVDEDRKRELISYLIGSQNWQQVLIFTRTKLGADALAKEMCKDGLKTQAIHGDKSQGARDRVLEEFREGKTRVLVATDLAARGLDIEELKYVVNYELPFKAEDYIHRIGRTGRAGGTGLAISLVCEDENYLLQEVETKLETQLPQQWFPGFEPDLTREVKKAPRRNSRGAQKQRARERALGKKPTKRRR
ncbi:DEAD/DEAH box helicase [Pontibacterium sp.]|uniref:DEAD/DEAH box helicase n=1 Tax=Pontibacterium sp. TaxID=2036026 RepID=UPI0035653985